MIPQKQFNCQSEPTKNPPKPTIPILPIENNDRRTTEEHTKQRCRKLVIDTPTLTQHAYVQNASTVATDTRGDIYSHLGGARLA